MLEAALRTAYYLVTKEQPGDDMFRDVRDVDGTGGWREATFDLAGTDVRVAVASGLGNADKVCRAILAGEAHYDFVEIMACPGGCVGGGGQPIHDGEELAFERGTVLYGIDKAGKIRNSHDNPDIKRIYEDFLGEPNSELAERLLHTDLHGWSMPYEDARRIAWEKEHAVE